MDKEQSIINFEQYLNGRSWNEREYQRDSIEKIIDYFEEGKKLVMSSLPTGAGKTLINIAVASGCGSAYYVTGDLYLQKQIVDDKFPDVCSIKGRANYDCGMMNVKCDEGLCQKKKSYRCEEGCDYKIARDAAKEAKIMLTNIFYFLVEGGRNFDKRELLIVDEGHSLPEQLVAFSKSTISTSTVGREVYEEAKDYINEPEEFVKGVRNSIDSILYDYDEQYELNEKELKEYRRLQNVDTRLQNCQDAGGIIVDKQESKNYEWIIVQPTLAKRVSKKLIFDRADKVLISSATINPFLIRDEMDVVEVLGKKKTAYFQIPSIFPVENRKLMLMPVCNFSYKNQDIPNTLVMLDVIAAILNKHKDERGIIFCQGYRYIKMLEDISYDYPELELRLVFHSKENRKKVINDWMSNIFDNKVLVGIKAEEGLDLKDNIARFSICFKSPFSSMLDKRVDIRVNSYKHWNWYNMLAQQTLCQLYGRIVRSETDYGTTYILDEGACKLLKRKGSPEWIKEAIVEMDYKDMLEKYSTKEDKRKC